MSDQTAISWTDSTFNPWFGCTNVSPGCDHCYAEALMDKRYGKVEWGAGKPRVRTSPANWRKPVQWNKEKYWECASCGWRGTYGREQVIEADPSCPGCHRETTMLAARRRVFCASLADVFDSEVPSEWRADLFKLIVATPNLDYLLLTKRISNARRMIDDAIGVLEREREAGGHAPRIFKPWPIENVWLGATVVNQEEANRDIPKLLATPARVRFLSMEPLLGPVGLHWNGWLEYPTGIDWVIVGGESGHGARPMHPAWVRALRDQCDAAGVPFHFKQHGEWLPTEFATDEQANIKAQVAYVNADGEVHDGDDGADFFGSDEQIARVGKKVAGRLLDGRTWDEFPRAA